MSGHMIKIDLADRFAHNLRTAHIKPQSLAGSSRFCAGRATMNKDK